MMNQPPFPPLPDQVRLLSDGTLATLTGLNRYKDLDKIRIALIQFAEQHAGEYETWQPAWHAFWEQYPKDDLPANTTLRLSKNRTNPTPREFTWRPWWGQSDKENPDAS